MPTLICRLKIYKRAKFPLRKSKQAMWKPEYVRSVRERHANMDEIKSKKR